MAARRWQEAVMFTALAGYVVLLATGPRVVPDWLTAQMIGTLVYLLPLLIVANRARIDPAGRPWTVPMAFATLAFMIGGNLSYTPGSGLASSVGLVAYLLVYPLLLLALMMTVREHFRRTRLIVTLDGLAAALSAASVAAWVVAPLVSRLWDLPVKGTSAVAFCLGDVVLLAVAFGALGVVGVAGGRPFLFWAAGMMAFSVGDIIYAYRLAFDSYQAGTWTDSIWALGFALMAAGVNGARREVPRRLPGAGSLVVVALASGFAVVVLAAAPGRGPGSLPSVLALLALVACGARLLVAFAQLHELTDAREQALTDELTGIANRRALYAALDRRFAPAEMRTASVGGARFSLAIIDLDHFKEVNDSFGHAAGDELLRGVVARFCRALKQLDTPYLFARLGGDEFAVLLSDVGAREGAMACGVALQESLAEPIALDEVVLHVQASVGVAVAPEDAHTRGDMLFAADAAMYAAKTSGETVCCYSPSAAGDRRTRLEVAEDLYSALERDELAVEYQPIMSADGHLVGAEALVRWDHPTRGRLSPGEFLDIAERYRLTPSIAQRVLDVALSDLRRWRSAGSIVRLSVNVSASDLRADRLVDIVAEALLTHGVPPSVLTIEITESAMMSDPEMAQRVMHALDDLGVQLSVDDYGTGYSSLEYLLKLPINEIKLDRAFSVHLVDEVRSVAIVRSTVDLTHALGLRMVAEGVENERTLAILRDLGCDLVQGWHLGQPMPAAAFEAFITSQDDAVRTGPPVGLAS